MRVLQLQQQNVPATAAYTEYSFKVPPNVFQRPEQISLG
jgi:hypothetical protein